MTAAYTLPLTCLDCGSPLDLSPGELHDTDHTSAAARLYREPAERTRDEIHAARIGRAADAAILTNGIGG